MQECGSQCDNLVPELVLGRVMEKVAGSDVMKLGLVMVQVLALELRILAVAVVVEGCWMAV